MPCIVCNTCDDVAEWFFSKRRRDWVFVCGKCVSDSETMEFVRLYHN